MTKKIQASYNFTVEPQLDGYKITYSKDKFGFGLGCGIFFIVLLLSPLISVIIPPITKNLFFNWFALPTGLTIIIYKLINSSRKDKTFFIGNDYIDVDNGRYSIKDIKKIYIKDPKGNLYKTTNNDGGRFVMAGTGMGAIAVGAASMASSGARATSEIMNKSIHKASFRIEFLYGNKKIPLATGLSEDNAFVLFDRVLELTDQNSQFNV